MFKLSTKERYGCRLMLNLALNYEDGQTPVILKNIAAEEEISIRYLEQIIIPLRNKALVKSVRGAGGGYILAKSPEKITVMDIIVALDGPIVLVECSDDPEACHRIDGCITHDIWKDVTRMLRDYFSEITLDNMIEMNRRKAARGSSRLV